MKITNFKQLELNEQMLDVTKKLYFKEPTQIQAEAIPAILAGKSVVGESQTGSGKTHAFLLPLMNQLKDNHTDTQIVITTPTRELAMQIHEEVRTIIDLLDKESIWQSRLIVGGIDREKMMRQLKINSQIVIGTPGRILDMINEGALSIYSATSFVIDEADLMLDFRFIETIDQLLVTANQAIQLLVFSATIPQQLQHFLKKYLKNPITIRIEGTLAPETMEHRLIDLKHRDVTKYILSISKIIQPYVALLFTNSKESADELAANLKTAGLNVGVLHGGLTSRERKRVVQAIVNLQYQYIVATDLASRGIDIKGASHVINVELPKEIDFYVHRVGRTARAGLEGTAISFYTENDIPLIKELEKRGIQFLYSDLKSGDWVDANRFNRRALRKNKTTEVDNEAWKRVRRPKKVKPGYKKRMKYEQERIKKQLMNKKRKK